MKEQINPQENKKILLDQKLQKLDEVNKYWDSLGKSYDITEENKKSTVNEGEVRSIEDYVVGDLILSDFKREDLSEKDLEIISEYLSIGDNLDLKEKLANKFGIEYRSPFSENPTHDSKAAEQISKENESEKNYN